MSKFRRRTLTRLAAVQALFQNSARPDIQPIAPATFLTEANYLQENALKGLDKVFFSQLLTGATDNLDTLDSLIKNHLTPAWNFSRLDTVVRSILRLASFELLHFPNLPAPIIINEYLDVTGSFYGTEEEKKFINGVLNAIAKKVRN